MHFRNFRIFLFLLATGTHVAHAQSVNDAYTLSNLTVQGTARSMGFGNALGSIGGDFSSISVNPAGLGIYRTSEIMVTPGLRLNSSGTEYLGTVSDVTATRFNFNNYGIVFTDAAKGKRYEKRKWKSVAFAIGTNRVADLNRSYSMTGNNYTSTAGHVFEADANLYPGDATSTDVKSVPAYIGYQAYLINPIGRDSFATIIPYKGGVRQTKKVQEQGRINETVIALGANYQEQLMLGATIGIPTIRYNVTSSYSETLAPGNNEPNPESFTSFRLDQAIAVKGNGINLKLGAIFRANDNVRIGAAFHTPSYYVLTDNYSPGITSVVGNQTYELNTANGGLATNTFNYQFVTPWRGILSGSYIMKGVGFITLDYEYIGYNSMGYIYPPDDGQGVSYAQVQYDMNQSIASTYQNTSNVRVGAEALVTKYFMARLGLGYYGNPYKVTGLNGQRIDIGGGIGFRDKDFFVDLALVHSMYQAENVPYSVDYNFIYSTPATPVIPSAKSDFGLNNVAFTVGLKF